MPIKHETGGDLSNSGKWIEQEGWYHFGVIAATETPTKRDGSIIAGALGKIDVEALESTAKSEIGKGMDITLWPPEARHKDGGDFARKCLDRYWLALNLATRQQLEAKGTALEIDLAKARGAQFIAKLVKSSDGKFMQVDGANIFHVDDPAVKDQPKNVKALAIIPPAHRWAGEQSKPASEPAPPAGRPALSDL